MSIVAWFARNPVASNLLMLSVVGTGFLTLPRIKREIFPEFSIDTISVAVAYPGASPEEVEESICIKVEEEVEGVDGVERVSSTASEGGGLVLVELLDDADNQKVLDDIKSRIDAIETFPDEAEEPVVRELSFRRQVLNIAVSGDLDERSLKETADMVRDRVTNLPGITQADVVSTRPYEIAVEVSEDALQRHGLRFDDVAQAIRQGSLDLPGGSVKTSSGEILLRARGQAYVGRDFEDLVVLRRPDGTRVHVRDVATVRDAFADSDQAARFDGRPAALVQVFRIGDQDALAISDSVTQFCRNASSWLPEGVTLTPWLDQAELLRSRQDLLVRNGLQGFLLVFLVLALFLRFELAIWVSVGIPISFLGTLALMPWMDVSINMLSLFAFIVVLGIVVDDAIVVGENVFSHLQRGKSGLQAAIEGTQEVAIPVTFAILTTIAAFLPLLNVPGNTGPFWAVIGLAVIPTLGWSMIESKLILPAHLRHIDPKKLDLRRGVSGIWRRFQGLFADSLEAFAVRLYRPSLEFALRNRYLTVAAMLTALMLTGGAVAGGYVRFVFFPPVDGDNVVATLTMPQGTPVDVTRTAVQRIEAAALQLRDELAARAPEGAAAPIRHVLTAIGEQPYRKVQEEGGGRVVSQGYNGSHFGEVNIQLAPSEVRSFTSQEVADRWRELVGPVYGASELKYSSSLLSVGADVDVRLRSEDIPALTEATERLKEHLASIDGVFDVSDSFDEGKEELELRIRPEAEALGLSMADLARQVRQGFYGEEAQRVQRGRDDIKVMVRYPEDERRSLADVESMRIRTPSGAEIPFETVADVELGRGYSAIRRTSRSREISVTTEVDETRTDVNTVVQALETGFLPGLVAEYPGMTYAFEGEQKEQQETIQGLARGFLFALMLIYVLMAVPFRSYVQPLVVMSAIPFGLIGAVLGHFIMGMQLSVLSVVGIVALAGVVVNDSIVLVDFVNRRREEGGELLLAVREAGVRRFRPILLTSLTTFAGLTPLLLEKSVQALFLIPMAISLGFGVLFATFISLVLVPSGYLILDDVHRAWRWLYGRPGNTA